MTVMDLCERLTALAKTIEARKTDDPSASYTASLLAGGPAQCAQKFGEEAVEAALAGALEDRAALIEESADLLYHWLVLLAANGVAPDEVGAALGRREGVSGHAEKAAREN